MSVDASGTAAGNGQSYSPVLSPDGTKAAFTSDASDFGPTDTNGQSDVYVRDLAAGTTSLVSKSYLVDDSGGGYSHTPIFSPDGTKVAFESAAIGLHPLDWDAGPDIYVRDLTAGTTSLVTVNGAATAAGNGRSYLASFSPDSAKVLFTSEASDLGPNDTNGLPDLYVHDLGAGTTTLVSANAAGTDSSHGGAVVGEFGPSADEVVFETSGSDLGPTDTNLQQDVYVRDLSAGTSTLVSTNAAGTDGAAGASQQGSVSPDGADVAFVSTASDLGPTDSDGEDDCYLRNLASGTTTRLSDDDGPDRRCTAPAFDPAGGKVVFTIFTIGAPAALPSGSQPAQRGPEDPGSDIYVRDLLTDELTLVSADSDGQPHGPGTVSTTSVFSPDGAKVAFVSTASDLGPVDTNLGSDVYLRDLGDGSTSLVSAEADGEDAGSGWLDFRISNLPSPWTSVFTPDGAKVLFASTGTSMDPAIPTSGQNVFLAKVYEEPT